MENLRSASFIFIPLSPESLSEAVTGELLSPQEVYWHDNMINTGCEQSKMLSNLYPSLYDFFVNVCGVNENPPLLDYLGYLLHISTVNTPHEAAKKVFDVFVIWSDGLKSGALSFEDVEMMKRHLKDKNMNVLPTAQDKWVSLHSSFGLVCWCDDEKLADEFEKLNTIDFLSLCELTDEEKETLQVKISLIMKGLGIPALSEIVTREAIYYGPVDNSYETSLVRWIIPYAQRYISNMYRERYLELKLSGFEKINRLRIVVVEMLYYKNVLKQSNLLSKKRHECICLLQDEILYATREADPHSIFVELSHFLMNGNPELHLANFMHMITTMTESGSTKEQIETFVLHSQKVSKLSDEEPVWSIQSTGLTSLDMVTSATKRVTKSCFKPSSSSQSNRNWPPASWQTAPKSLNHKGHSGTSAVDLVNVELSLVDQDDSLDSSQKDQLSHGPVNIERATLTGRQGEELAFNYYKNMGGIKVVKWVNEARESGLPYDIEVCDDENRKEYIEVKTTDSETKDWFEISAREWQYAVKKGDSYSVARVVLLSNKRARVTVLKNPARLCQTGQLKLALLMSEKQQDGLAPR